MAEGKYGKYFFKNPIVKGKFGPRLIFYSRQQPVALTPQYVMPGKPKP